MSLQAINKLNKVLMVALVLVAVITINGVCSASKEITENMKAPIVASK